MLKRDYVSKGLAREIGILKKPIAQSYLKNFLLEVQEIEDAVFSIIDKLSIDDATGKLLEYIGGMVGEYRDGRSDADFRTGIYTQITINTADGSRESIRSILMTVTGAKAVKLLPLYPAELFITIEQGGPVPSNLISKIFAAGVDSQFNILLENKVAFMLAEEEGDPIGILPDEEDEATSNLMFLEEVKY